MAQRQTPAEYWMGECLKLARRGHAYVSPNPMVGAVVVKKNQVVARGFHRMFGGPHAEVECLNRFKGNPRGATLYVNLEPCAHQGKTPPCTDLIIKSGIRDVSVGMRDPNPLVRGRGMLALRRAGIRTEVGLREEECRELNKAFIRHMTTGLPFIHLKIAQTLDGKIADTRGRSRWISSPDSRRLVHKWRASHDAVLIGAQTIIVDDPLLNVRLAKGRNPHVVILDGRLRIPLTSRVLQPLRGRNVFLCTSTSATKRKRGTVQRLEELGVRVLRFPGVRTKISLRQVLKTLYRNGIGTLFVEGGSDVAGGFLYSGLVDQLSIFVAPRMMGPGILSFNDGHSGIKIRHRQVTRLVTRRVGNDVLLQFLFQ